MIIIMNFAKVKTMTDIFQEEALSFAIVMIPLNHVFRKCRERIKTYQIAVKDQLPNDKNNIKLFSKNEKDL